MTKESEEAAKHCVPGSKGLGAKGNARSHQGSLRSKLVLSLAAMFLVFLTLNELVRLHVINPEFIALEQANAIRDANHVLAAMNSEVDHLADIAHQWAHRIDKGIASPPSTTGTNAAEKPAALDFRGIDWAAIVQQDGSWDWIRGQATDHLRPPPPDVDNPLQQIVRSCVESKQPTARGMTRLGDQPLVIFAAIAIDASDTVPAPDHPRYLVISRVFNEEMVAALRRQTQIEFFVQPTRTLNPAQQLVVREVDESTLMIEIQLTGLNEEGLANICVLGSREITARLGRTASIARKSFILGSVAALLMLLLLLQRLVISPLSAIREHSNLVAEKGLAAKPMVVTANDEIGQLASSFDHMVDRLRDTQTQLAKASQAAGRSQVASTVIHNVGNVLTNVNSLLASAIERVQGLRVGPLDKLAGRLKQTQADEALMKATPDYLKGLAGSLRSDQETLRQLLETLHDNIHHIHDVIRDQQRHTDHFIKASPVNLKTVLGEAIGCCQAQLDHNRISIELSGPLSITVRSNRTLLLQTLINVIGNAQLAMLDNTASQPRNLHIDAKALPNSILIQFHDNGCGMTDETIRRAFDAHFTTRESGTGLGLHFCAITLKRLGGSIRASSDGIGHGSTFIVELPLEGSRLNDEAMNQNTRVTAMGSAS